MATLDMFRELDSLRREIDEAFRGAGLGRVLHPSFLAGPATRRFPQVNIAEDEARLYVHALIPGVPANEVEITVLGNTITISGERKAPEPGAAPYVWHRNERGYGKFRRTLDLPGDVDVNDVKADCRDGILIVSIAKAAAPRPKKIAINVG
ncbi:MAG TPA: Hsp20/alpha crystallin family protein [Verrucomicrobiae bacterium]|nr:Hsp20/alpha crystallin family protein [Verrucomicrobiae bacterium]